MTNRRSYWLKRLFLVMGILCTFTTLNAQEEAKKEKKVKFSGFSGGMMLHTGYITTGKAYNQLMGNDAILNRKIKGAPFGLGGVIKFHFGKHFRFGGEGHTSTLIYEKQKNRWTLGWGGPTADCMWSAKKWRWFVGGALGFGSVRHTIILGYDDSMDKLQKRALFRKYSVFMLVPYTGVEYAMTPKIGLYAKFDYAVSVTNRPPDLVEGCRFYIGFNFYHSK